MTPPPDFAEIDRLLEAALEKPPAERERWLDEVCGDDAARRESLRRLVALAETGDDVLPAGGALRGPVWDDLVRDLGEGDPPLEPGHRVGAYEIRGLLGAGGMGRVYRAYDPSLQREVAIKALAPSDAGQASDRRQRLEREARLLATLNHPNIAMIYGVERIDGALYLILELVEGPTLAERLERGVMPLDETIAVCGQIAAALEEAHRKDIVHRDLKPSNIKLAPDGRVKVLDFGIAKPGAGALQAEAAAGVGATAAGRVIGTPAYMSPEQVRGEPADTRADVWAFGCLLYEMLAGRRAFGGATPTEVLASVLRDDPDWNGLPAHTPPSLRRLLRRCLRREARERLQHIGDARLDLDELDTEEHRERSGETPARRTVGRLAPWILGGLGAIGVTLALFAGMEQRPAARPSSVVRFPLELPAGLSIAEDFAVPFAIASDGARIAVLAEGAGVYHLFVRDLEGLDTRPLAGTERAWQPFFSPDGREIAFFADRKLKKVAVDGGAVQTLCDIGRNPRGGSWGPGGTIVIAPSSRSGLVRVDASQCTLTPVTHLDLARGEGSHRWPQVLPGGRWVLFTSSVVETMFDESRIEAVSLETGERRILHPGASHGRYAGGRLFFTREGRVHAVSFDPETLTARGEPVLVLEGVRYDPRSGSADFALSDTGTLVYRPAPPTSAESFLAWVDASGQLTRISDTARRFREPQLSPDGRRVAVRVAGDDTSTIWIFETDASTSTRVCTGDVYRPVWTADQQGLTVAMHEGRRWKLVTFPAGRPGSPVTVFESDNRMYPNAWSHDGRALIFQELRPETSWDLRVLDIGANGRAAGAPRDLAAMPYQERNAALSADGRRMAFEADEPDGIAEIYVAPFPGPGPAARATVTSGRWPQWGEGDQLYWWLPVGRPPDAVFREGLHRMTISRAPEGILAASEPVWPPEIAEPLLRRLVVTVYASFGLAASASPARVLVLESSLPSPEERSLPTIVGVHWLDNVRVTDGR